MNKYKKDIFKNATIIGQGSSRVAFVRGGKVIKFPYRKTGSYQNLIEEAFYDAVKHEYADMFPNPKFFGNMIVMDYVPTLDDIFNYTDEPIADLEKSKNLVKKESLDRFYSFVEKARQIGISVDEFFYNGGNVGLSNGEIKILDWGSPEGYSKLFICDNKNNYLENLYKRLGRREIE